MSRAVIFACCSLYLPTHGTLTQATQHVILERSWHWRSQRRGRQLAGAVVSESYFYPSSFLDFLVYRCHGSVAHMRRQALKTMNFLGKGRHAERGTRRPMSDHVLIKPSFLVKFVLSPPRLQRYSSLDAKLKDKMSGTGHVIPADANRQRQDRPITTRMVEHRLIWCIGAFPW